jgi:predicted MPP superfamily phosphohydrolase
MKKIIVISDIHGRTIWKTFADIKHLLVAEPDAAGFGPFEPEYNQYIFLGDYTDSFTESNETIRENLLEIIRFKTLYPNNVILLWGNHDTEYYLNQPWLPLKTAISGFRPEMHYDLYEIFDKNANLFQVAFQIENYIFSHAGIHIGWYFHVFNKAIKDKGWNDLSVADQINEAFNQRIDCIFDVDHYRGGYKKVGGPLWCSKQLIDKKPLKNYHQIVGHTVTDDFDKYIINDNTSITFCDVLHKRNAYYILNI